MRHVATLLLTGACASAPPPLLAPSDADPPLVADRPLCELEREAPPPTLSDDLAQWVAAVQAGSNPYYGAEPLETLIALADPTPDELLERGAERAEAGDIPAGIADLRLAADLAADPRARLKALDTLASLLLRDAELHNCAGGLPGVCTWPFQPEGLHADPTLAHEAIDTLSAALSDDADPEGAPARRWLLAVALGAAGEDPASVPEAWRIPDPPTVAPGLVDPWLDHGAVAGLRDPTHAGGAQIADLDGDGVLDLLFSSMSPTGSMQLLLGRGDGTWCEATRAAGIGGVVGVLNFAIADVDNDGDLDVAAPRGGWMFADGEVRPSLLRNDGEGRFTDVAVEAGLADTVGPSQVAAWADVDGDGCHDLFIGREAPALEEEVVPYPASLYLGDCAGGFVDAADRLGVDRLGLVKGASWGDVDDDGDPDLLVSRFGQGPTLLRNDDGVGFTPLPLPALPRLAFANSMVDLDQDGDLDLIVAGYPESGPVLDVYAASLLGLSEERYVPRVYLNDGAGVFTDATVALGFATVAATMGLGVGDLNADGFPDLIQATGATSLSSVLPNAAWLNDRGAGLIDVTSATRLGNLQKGHAVAFGDLDEDGDADLVIELGGAFPVDGWINGMFENPLRGAPSVTLRLEGTTAPRDALGARVRVVSDAGHVWHRVGPGTSFGGNALEIVAALPGASRVEVVDVWWPDGDFERVWEVPLGEIVTLRQGQGVVATRARRPAILATGELDHDHAPP